VNEEIGIAAAAVVVEVGRGGTDAHELDVYVQPIAGADHVAEHATVGDLARDSGRPHARFSAARPARRAKVDRRCSIWQSGLAKEAADGRRAGSCGIHSRMEIRPCDYERAASRASCMRREEPRETKEVVVARIFAGIGLAPGAAVRFSLTLTTIFNGSGDWGSCFALAHPRNPGGELLSTAHGKILNPNGTFSYRVTATNIGPFATKADVDI
jgi:hypothetical protein